MNYGIWTISWSSIFYRKFNTNYIATFAIRNIKVLNRLLWGHVIIKRHWFELSRFIQFMTTYNLKEKYLQSITDIGLYFLVCGPETRWIIHHLQCVTRCIFHFYCWRNFLQKPSIFIVYSVLIFIANLVLSQCHGHNRVFTTLAWPIFSLFYTFFLNMFKLLSSIYY